MPLSSFSRSSPSRAVTTRIWLAAIHLLLLLLRFVWSYSTPHIAPCRLPTALLPTNRLVVAPQERVWRPRSGEWESGDSAGRARVPCAKGDNGTPPDFALCRELWTGRITATSRQRSGTQECHMHHGNQRDGSIGQNLGWKLCVKDKWVKQESQTLDPEWRD